MVRAEVGVTSTFSARLAYGPRGRFSLRLLFHTGPSFQTRVRRGGGKSTGVELSNTYQVAAAVTMSVLGVAVIICAWAIKLLVDNVRLLHERVTRLERERRGERVG